MAQFVGKGKNAWIGQHSQVLWLGEDGSGSTPFTLPFDINADGWRVTYPSPPTFDPVGSPETFTVTRAGFDATGAATTHADTVTLMKRVRQAYPNQASLTSDQVAMSDFVYDGDTVNGATNNSTRAYPKPIAMWITRDLQHIRPSENLVAGLSVIHAHGRNGKPVAAVKFIATDGTNTVEQTVSTMTTREWTTSSLWGAYFECDIDISTLTQGALCTLDAIIYPWVGEEFQLSVDADAYPSANLTTQRFLCDRTGAYGTAYAYVDGVGAGTPAVSTTPATAEANPYATVAAAASAIQTYNNSNFSRNSASGGIIRLKVGTHARTSFSSVAVTDVPLIIEADDIANKATVIFADNGTSVSNGVPDKTCWRNMTFQRTSGSSLQFLDANATISNLDYLCALENVHIDLNGQSTYDAWIYRLGRLWLEDVTGGWSGIFNVFSTTSKHVHMVGCSGAWATQGSLYHAFATRLTANARIQQQPGLTNGAATLGMHLAYCHFTNTAQQAIVTYNDPIGDRGFGIAMTVLEQTGGLTQVCLNLGTDAGDAVQNAVRVGVTAVGARTNTIYQDAGTTFVDKSGYEIGCISRGRNCKSDIFGVNSNLTGNWPTVFQVGHRHNVVIRGGEDSAAVGTNGAWVGEVAAINSQYGTDVSPLAVAWVDDASTDGSTLGGGDYRPDFGSVIGFLPTDSVHYPIDSHGAAIPLDGSAKIGAKQAFHFVPPGIATKTAIEGLRDGTTTPNGRNSVNPLKVPNVDPLEPGWSWTATPGVLEIAAGEWGLIQDWDFREFEVQVASGADVLGFVQCLFGQTTNVAQHLYGIDIHAGARVREIGFCTFEDYGGVYGLPALINCLYSGSDADPNIGSIDWLHDSRFLSPTADHLKLAGSESPNGCIVENVYLGPPAPLPTVATIWDAGTTYNIPDTLRKSGLTGWSQLHVSKIDGNIGQTPPAHLVSDAFWSALDKHTDGITTVAAKNGISIHGCLVDLSEDRTGDASLTDRIGGVNNAWRVVRNTGDTPRFDHFSVVGGMASKKDLNNYLIQVNAGGGANWTQDVQFSRIWLEPSTAGTVITSSPIDVYHEAKDIDTDASLGNPASAPDTTDPVHIASNSVAPSISGTVQTFSYISFNAGTWDWGIPRARLEWTVQSSANGVSGWSDYATVYHGRDYQIPAALDGLYIRVRVRAKHAMGDVDAFSASQQVNAASGPTVESGTWTGANSNSTTFTWTLPTGWQIGERVNLVVVWRNGDAKPTAPSGWTEVIYRSGFSGGAGGILFYTRIMQSGDTNPSITLPVARTLRGAAFRISGSSGMGLTNNATSFAKFRNSQIVNATLNSLIFHVFAWNNGAISMAPVAGLTIVGPISSNSGAGSGYDFVVAYEVVGAGNTQQRQVTSVDDEGFATVTVEVLD